MRNFLIAILACMFMQVTVTAQQVRCGNDLLGEQLANNPATSAAYADYIEKNLEINRKVSTENDRAQAKVTAGQVLIPVVFHIILTDAEKSQLGGEAGIHDRILTQIQVLNEDFNADNADLSQVPAEFQGVIGDAQINFGVAKIGPDGKAKYGVEFLDKPAGFGGYNVYDASTKRTLGGAPSGGLDPWDIKRYLNVWVIKLNGSINGAGSVLGYAFNADYAQNNYGDPNLAGAVIHYLTLGRRTSVGQAFFSNGTDKGRTLTHELGHFFNVFHIWGNTAANSPSANCNDDDGFADTPQQEDANMSCPTFPKANCTNTTGGEMFMNFMDYSGDRCTHMFSKDQVARIRADVEWPGTNHSLTLNPEYCFWPAGVSAVEYNNKVTVAPNPSNGIVKISILDKYNYLNNIAVTNVMGQVVTLINVTNQQKITYDLDLTSMPKGIYVIQLNFDEGMISKKVTIQ